uniref:Uncharacterized protein n=1 Tax=Oryza glaberrima TaxID=4538 RepID=I1NPY1_ORYGL
MRRMGDRRCSALPTPFTSASPPDPQSSPRSTPPRCLVRVAVAMSGEGGRREQRRGGGRESGAGRRMGAEAKVKRRRLGANEVVRSHPLALSPPSSRRFLLLYRRPHCVVLHATELIGAPAKGVGSLVG